ncbi:hypothetical protein GSI_07174 [Ganoderma sinense ZZ0214-1]|uniref:Fungal-type protein kinase domain-containing protein n=1 Tax=Ganoderma sinense ZZ0214-1 TaxID=1077348 RepID=A0A2G8S9P1_9APHY|nr:hypothetical protein GSI_07174 [Ganoderma sinense ZZ0214-1]
MADVIPIPEARSCVYNIPLALDHTLLQTRGPEPHFAKSRNANLLADCKRAIAGPMPFQQFMDHFLPQPSKDDRTNLLESFDAFKSVPPSAIDAAEIYEPLVAALNARDGSKSRCPGFVFEVAANRSLHPKRAGYVKPHICCYTPNNSRLVSQSDPSSRVEFGYAELFINVQPDPTLDFFADPPPDSEPAARTSHDFMQRARDEDGMPVVNLVLTLGQHVAYAAEVFARQPRTFLFTVALSGSRARLLRWDRAGGVATEAFDLREQPGLLCEFLWRFSQASCAGRGHDTSVQAATEEEERLFREVIERHARSQLDNDDEQALKNAVAEHYKAGHVYAIDILHQRPQSGERTRRFLVSRPLVSTLSLFGRGTRGYWATDKANRSIAFIKDTWRSSSLSELEAETLQHLNDLGVDYVPSVTWYGDVEDSGRVVNDHCEASADTKYQHTLSHEVMSKPWVCLFHKDPPFAIRRRHHRLVMGTVGYNLNRLRGTEELLHATYDVYTAMRQVLAKDSRIHRDISVGNIVLVQEPGKTVRSGYLIDWETSCKVDDAGASTEMGRVGTWQYVSIRMLREDHGQTGKATFQDEMESLLYVVLYCALLWQPHNVSMKQLTSTVTELFDSCTEFEAGIKDGGDGKMVNAMHRVYTRSARFENQDLSEWLNTVMDFHSPRPHQEAEYKDKWSNPEQLDAYWSNFLQTRTLDRNNRADNKLDHFDFYDSITPPSPPPRYLPPRRLSKTPPPPFPRRCKRKINEPPGDLESQPDKQARTEL